MNTLITYIEISINIWEMLATTKSTGNEADIYIDKAQYKEVF